MRAVVAATGTARMPCGRETGVYLSELVDTWTRLAPIAGELVLATPAGGRVPLEAVRSDDPEQAAFLAGPGGQAVHASVPFAAVEAPVDVLVVVGGHGAVCDLGTDHDLGRLVAGVLDGGGVVGAVCHGVAGLLAAPQVLAGRRVAAFTDAEERAVGMSDRVPYSLSAEITAAGAAHVPGPPFMPHVVEDGPLVTGQNPASAAGVAEAVARLARPRADAVGGRG